MLSKLTVRRKSRMTGEDEYGSLCCQRSRLAEVGSGDSWQAIGELDLELAVLTGRETIQWLTGALVRAPYEPVAVLRADGHVLLVLPERQLGEAAAVDEKLGYPAKLHSTLVDDQRAASSATLQTGAHAADTQARRRRVRHVQSASDVSHVAGRRRSLPTSGRRVSQLRRHKDPDELAMLRRANDANRAMYERAREIVRPGVNEIDVYNELAAVAVRTLGEPLTYFGQDFRSAARGGAPRNRAIEAGELYIFDLGVGFRGYYSDNCPHARRRRRTDRDAAEGVAGRERRVSDSSKRTCSRA